MWACTVVMISSVNIFISFVYSCAGGCVTDTLQTRPGVAHVSNWRSIFCVLSGTLGYLLLRSFGLWKVSRLWTAWWLLTQIYVWKIKKVTSYNIKYIIIILHEISTKYVDNIKHCDIVMQLLPSQMPHLSSTCCSSQATCHFIIMYKQWHY